jgi:hypothetical protein
VNQIVALRQATLPIPTADEPIPKLAGASSLRLLRTGTAKALAEALSPDEKAAIVRDVPDIVDAERPATRKEMVLSLERLQLHYPAMKRTDAETLAWVTDWYNDVGAFPADLIEEGCRLWRTSKADRFPTIGQLKALVEELLLIRRHLARRAREFLELTADQPLS